MVDSIAVSVFADILIELTSCGTRLSIRQQDPNIYSDTEARCLVYSRGQGRSKYGAIWDKWGQFWAIF